MQGMSPDAVKAHNARSDMSSAFAALGDRRAKAKGAGSGVGVGGGGVFMGFSPVAINSRYHPIYGNVAKSFNSIT